MSEPKPYNLLCKPWIPVVWCHNAMDSKEKKVGLRNALLLAHEIKCVSHVAPFVEFGIYRLLITIVLDTYIVEGRRPTVSRVRQLLQAGKFDASLIQSYLGKYATGFDLWGDGPRFLQRKPAARKKGGAVVRMFAAVPSGNNVALWTHFTEDEIGLTEGDAAQFLTAVSPWNFKNKPGEARTLAGDPPMYALVLGMNLFDTIVLNLPGPNGRVTAQHERDNGPVWRTALEDLNNLPRLPTVAQGFTWPVRIIQLEDNAGLVVKATNQAAYKKPTEKAKRTGGTLYDPRSAWRDPNAGTVTSSDSIEHIKPRPGVPVWRDAVPLFLVASEGEVLRGAKRRSRPEVVSNALRVLDATELRVAVYGMRKKGTGGGDVKVEEWFRSVLKLPAEVARDDRLSARVLHVYETAQSVADALGTALRMLRPARGSTERRPERGEVDTLQGFWHGLEPLLAREYLKQLAAHDPMAERELLRALGEAARCSFRHAAAPLRRSADGLFRVANAKNYLERRLGRLLSSRKSS